MEAMLVDNPFTGAVACEVTMADSGDVSLMLDQAKGASKAFQQVELETRIAICERAMNALDARQEAMATDVTRLMGKPIGQARAEAKKAVARGRALVSLARKALAESDLPGDGVSRKVLREPHGVVLVMPTWNSPILTLVGPLVTAVLAGNAVVVKHAVRTSLVTKYFVNAFDDGDAPWYLVQRLDCDYPTLERVMGDPRVDHLVYAGSHMGAMRLKAAIAGRFVGYDLFLGGNDAAYVAHDCDFDRTVEEVVRGAMTNAGQDCAAVERVYVHRTLFDRFVDAAEARMHEWALGDPAAPGTRMGPLAKSTQIAELERLMFDAANRGGCIVLGGKRRNVDGLGRFFEPTLVTDVRHDMQIIQREVLGPVLPVVVVDSDEEAVARMNDVSVGLTASLWTKDAAHAERIARQLEAGTVYLNRCNEIDPLMPWSGRKGSGNGVGYGLDGFYRLTRPKSLLFQLTT